MSSDSYEELATFLKAKGHSEDEVIKIMELVKQYDINTQHDSVMDSIQNGQFNLAAIIEEALGKDDE